MTLTPRRCLPLSQPLPLRLCVLLCLLLCAPSAAAQDDDPAAQPKPDNGDLFGSVVVQPITVKHLLVALPQAVSVGAADASGLDALITDQLKLDLHMSGYFEMAPPESFGLIDLAKDGQTASTIDFNGWLSVGADWLIKASYEPQGGGKAKLDIRVFDVHTGKQVKLPKWKPSVVTEGNYRYAVHAFVNDLLALKTDGPQGPFGSVMTFSGSDTGNNRKIFMLELGGKGAGEQPIPRGINVMPTWGPGDTLYFNTFPEDQPITLRQFNRADGGAVTEVASQAYGVDYCASKDLLAFTDHGDLYTMRPDGSERRQLTHDGYSPADVSPSWGPGCSELAFVSDRDGGQPQIFVMRADGSSQRRVTYLGNYNTSPDWSPNIKGADGSGSWIAFTARDEFAHFDVFVIRPDGSEIFRVTQDQGDNYEPSWSPDGRYLVFESTRDGSREPRLYMARMDVKGAWQVRVSDGFGFRTPVWNR